MGSDFMNRQPGAYANFRGDQYQHRAQLASQLSMAKWAPGMFDYSQAPGMKFNSNEPLLHPDNCPNWLIRDLPISGLPALCHSARPHGNPKVPNKLLRVPKPEPIILPRAKIDNGRKIKVPNKHRGEDCIRQYEFKNILHKSDTDRNSYYYEKDRTRGWKPKYCPRSLPTEIHL